MLIPKHHRKQLKAIGFTRWFWSRIHDWAYGERYRFRDGTIAYLYDGKIITIRRGGRILWRDNDVGTS